MRATGYRPGMSCLHFTTAAERASLKDRTPLGLSNEDAALLHRSPPVTESKIRRLRLLAASPVPAIRQSVASSRNTPVDLFEALAVDSDASVRGCVARNDAAPEAVLRGLVTDRDQGVRCWLAVNHAAPADVLTTLRQDRSSKVRSLARLREVAAAARPAAVSEPLPAS